jgi:hypothetical protein
MKVMTYGADSEWTLPRAGAITRAAVIEAYKTPNIMENNRIVRALQEVATTEQNYTTSLRYLYEHVLLAFEAVPKLDAKFGVARLALQRLIEVHSKVEKDLQLIRIGERNQEVFSFISVITIFTSVVGVFPFYADYIMQYQKISDVLELKDKAIVKFKNEFKSAESRQVSLEGYLIMPVSRMPRYNLLLNEVKMLFSMYEDLTDEVKMLDELLAAVREASATINQLYNTSHDTKKDVEEVSKMVKKSGSCIIS